MTKTITMTEKELFKLGIINKLIEKTITIGQAREQIGLSVRQIKRLKRKVIKGKADGIIHGLRGKESHRKTPQIILDKASRLLKESYADFKPTFAAEKLKLHKISLSKERVRRLMSDLNLWKPRKRKENGEYRSWRPRKEWFGSLEQFDGSYHRWFENRGEECCLLTSIDDAMGTITRAEFGYSESVKEVSAFWRGYVIAHGKPQSIYLDKFSTYKINHKSAADNHELMTQFQRMMQEIDINPITAHSPEAKGRIERLFQTLQDRLVKELRLAGISTISKANVFLKETFIPAFNAQFGVAAAKEGDLHRPLSEAEKTDLDAIFSVQRMRKVGNDFTIRFENQWIQLEKVQPCTVCRGDSVLIEKRLDDTLHIRLKKKYLAFKVLPERPPKLTERVTALVPKKKREPWKPSINHPWKKSFLISQRQG